MVPGKTTARAWRQPVTGFSQALAVVRNFHTILEHGHGMHKMPKQPLWCRHHLQGMQGWVRAAGSQTRHRNKYPGSSDGVSEVSSDSAPTFSAGAKIPSPEGPAPPIDHAASS